MATGWESGTRSCGPEQPVYDYSCTGRGAPSHRNGRIHLHESYSATGTNREQVQDGLEAERSNLTS